MENNRETKLRDWIGPVQVQISWKTGDDGAHDDLEPVANIAQAHAACLACGLGDDVEPEDAEAGIWLVSIPRTAWRRLCEDGVMEWTGPDGLWILAEMS